jgi:hypothetical protein
MPNNPTHSNDAIANATDRPTARQLNYLRSLAARTATTFSYPRTRAQASAEITRLKAVDTAGFTFAEHEARASHGDVPLHDSAVVRDDEIAGYGSTATWSRLS